MSRKRPEQELQIQIADYLRAQYPQLLWFHPNNNIPMANKARMGGILKRMGVRAGVADIILIWMGKEKPCIAAIELKADKGKQQPTQSQFMADMTSAGGYYTIAYSLDDVQQALKSWEVPRAHLELVV